MKFSLSKLLRDWPALWSLPASLGIWFVSPWFLRKADATSATFDAGVLQVLLFAILAISLADFVGWLFVKLCWPTLNRYVDDGRFSADWVRMDPAARILCTIAVFALHFLGFVFLCRVL